MKMKVLQIAYSNSGEEIQQIISGEVTTLLILLNQKQVTHLRTKVTNIYSFSKNRKWKTLRRMINYFGQDSFALDSFQCDLFNDFLQNHLLNHHYDLIVINEIYMCHYIPTIRGNSKARIILNATEIAQKKWFQSTQEIVNPILRYFEYVSSKRLSKFENASINLVDAIVTKSSKERNTFRALGAKVPILIYSDEIPVNGLFTETTTDKFNINISNAAG